jgi:hypothetical protein
VPVIGDTGAEPDETFHVDLTGPTGVTIARASATVTIVNDDQVVQTRSFLAVVGSTPGAGGSFFKTAVQLINTSSSPITGQLVIHPAGGGADVTIPYSLGPGEVRYFADLLEEVGLSGLATLDVVAASGDLPRIVVRIYNDAGIFGTTGFTLPPFTALDVLRRGDAGFLAGSPDPLATRFNIGVRAFEEGVELKVMVRSASGSTLAVMERTYPSNSFSQVTWTTFTGLPLSANDYLVIEVVRGSAIIYGASVDNITNDSSVQFAIQR